MIKIKYIFVFCLLTAFFYSCGDSDTIIEPYDDESQAVIDNDLLIEYMKKNYYDSSIDSIKPLVSGKTPIFTDSKLKTMTVNFDNIDYKLYVYVSSEGTPMPDKGKPTIIDSILVNYHLGYFIDSLKYVSIQNLETPTWFDPRQIGVEGWLHGFTNFKGGENITANGPITYQNGGKGVLLIPSGLGYRSFGSNSIPPNANLVYYVNLFDLVKDTDHDNDGIPSILEDIDGDGNPRNDDSDGDGLANYLDADDDNDGILTKYEDKNLDGDPTNDFNDPNNPTLPDYLNFKYRFSKQ